MQALSTVRLSRSKAGGSVGSWLYGSSGHQSDSELIVVQEANFVDTF
jgi:hypothetical protein